MNQVTIMITGATPRTVDFRPGETLGQLSKRMASTSFPLNRIQTWYCGDAPVGNPDTFKLEGGMTVGGTPKIDGGRA